MRWETLSLVLGGRVSTVDEQVKACSETNTQDCAVPGTYDFKGVTAL